MNIYKTMYHAPEPDGIERRRAYIVGGGIAGLAAAAFLADDTGMPGENITSSRCIPPLAARWTGLGESPATKTPASVNCMPRWNACGICAANCLP